MQRYLREVLTLRGLHGDAVDPNVQDIGRIEEAAPEPGQVLAGAVLDGPKEIGRGRMLERPGADVFPERRVERRRTDDVISQGQHHKCRLAISDRAKRCWIDVVRRRHQWRLRSVT